MEASVTYIQVCALILILKLYTNHSCIYCRRCYVCDVVCDVCGGQRSSGYTVSSSTVRERESLVVTAALSSCVDGGPSSLSGSGLEVSGSVSVSVSLSGAGSGVPV